MIEIIVMEVSTLFLLKDQIFKGRCILALNDHKKEIFDLNRDERNSFFEDLSIAANSIYQCFKPDKINYAIFGDLVPHFHVHLVPKYKKGPLWGKAFCLESVSPFIPSDQELISRVNKIKENILK
jgi:diadenosine tetraphosphate (Ap4A) HIT family hydrolase